MAVDALAGRVTAGDRARGWAVTVRLRSADARARRRPRDEAVRVDEGLVRWLHVARARGHGRPRCVTREDWYDNAPIDGYVYKSLSKLAATISGQSCNGFAFFKLTGTPGAAAPKAAQARQAGKPAGDNLMDEIAKIDQLIVKVKAALDEGTHSGRGRGQAGGDGGDGGDGPAGRVTLDSSVGAGATA